jgi:hypothetical protein
LYEVTLSVLADFTQEPVHEEKTASMDETFESTLPDEDELMGLKWTSAPFRRALCFQARFAVGAAPVGPPSCQARLPGDVCESCKKKRDMCPQKKLITMMWTTMSKLSMRNRHPPDLLVEDEGHLVVNSSTLSVDDPATWDVAEREQQQRELSDQLWKKDTVNHGQSCSIDSWEHVEMLTYIHIA